MSEEFQSVTVQIPGGTATLRHPRKLKVKHKRRQQIILQSLGIARFMEIATIGIQEASLDGKTPNPLAIMETMDSLRLTAHEIEHLGLMNEAMVWGLLESWTLDEPLPVTPEDVGEMDGEVYDVLMAETARISAAHMAKTATGPDGRPVDPFSVGAVEDPTSPTGASAGSNGPSAGAGRRAPSTRKASPGGRSTGTGARSKA